MTVHYLKSGCIGKYTPLRPWDFPRAVVLGPRWMHFPIYPSSPQCFNLFCINMLSLPDYWFHNYFFKQLTIKSIRLTKIFLVCVGLGLYGDQTFGLYGDQTVPSKEGLLAPPVAFCPSPVFWPTLIDSPLAAAGANQSWKGERGTFHSSRRSLGCTLQN